MSSLENPRNPIHMLLLRNQWDNWKKENPHIKIYSWEEVEMRVYPLAIKKSLKITRKKIQNLTLKLSSKLRRLGQYDCPTFILLKREQKRIRKPWRNVVIVKLLGRKIVFKAWKPD